MLNRKRYIIILFLSLWALPSNAQGNRKPKKFFQNQLELGINYCINTGNRSHFIGFGYGDGPIDFSWLSFYTSFIKLHNLNNYQAYKMIFNEKHVLKLSCFENYTYPNKTIGANETFALYNKVSGLGYGYLTKLFGINFTLLGQICQREGGELVWLDSPYDFDKIAYLYYDSYGASIGLDAEYFFTKNLALGVNFNYYNFAFEDAKLGGTFLTYTHPYLVQTYKPVTSFFIINIKLAYRFSFPTFKKK